MATESRTLQEVLFTSNGKETILCVICKEQGNASDVCDIVRADIPKAQHLEVGSDTFYADVRLKNKDQCQACLDCLMKLFQSFDLLSITVMVDGDEPFEFYPDELPVAA